VPRAGTTFLPLIRLDSGVLMSSTEIRFGNATSGKRQIGFKMMKSTAGIPSDWINWIAENRALGVAAGEIIDVLVANGFDRHIALEHVAVPANNRRVHGGEVVATKLRKLESLMSIYSDLWSQSRGAVGVDRVSHLAADGFFRWYYSINRPVVLVDQMRSWAALGRWTPDYLKARCGDAVVEVMMGRNADAEYEINCERHKTQMRLDQYVALVQSAGRTNDFYMVANNRSIEAGKMRHLLDDIQLFDGILDPENAAASVFLWFGPAGTVTPLHHDAMNILLAQVLGRKKVTLIPSFETHLVYNHVGVYSEVDCEAPDYNRHPLFQYVSPLEIIVEPGEVLFIPVGWWHHVRSLDVSISVSFTNFRVPNSYAWSTEG
jgi:Cupin-like domain